MDIITTLIYIKGNDMHIFWNSIPSPEAIQLNYLFQYDDCVVFFSGLLRLQLAMTDSRFHVIARALRPKQSS